MWRAKSFLLLCLIVVSTVVSMLTPMQASALTDSTASVREKLSAYLYMRAMEHCFHESWLSTVEVIPLSLIPKGSHLTPTDAKIGKWFTDDNPLEKDTYPYGTGQKKSCADTDFPLAYVKMFNYTDAIDALGDNGLRIKIDDGNFEEDGSDIASRVPSVVAGKWGREPYLDSALTYMLLKDVLINSNGCNATPTTDRTLASGDKGTITKIVNESGEVVETLYLWGSGLDDGTERVVTTKPGGADEDKRTCQKIADDLSASAAAFAASDYPVKSCEIKFASSTSQIDACNDGMDHKDELDYCAGEYPITDLQTACIYGQNHAKLMGDVAGGADDEGADKVTSCQIEAIGWLVCPVVRFIAKTTDGSYSVVRTMMTVQPSIFDTSNSSSAYAPWEKVRSVANIAFILAFLVVIYSYLTSSGISNYNLKKMFPKLIMGALLVNASFWICAGLVDLSNVLGTNIYKVINDTADSIYPPDIMEGAGANTGFGGTWDKLAMVAIGVGGIALIAGGLVSIAIFLPLLLSAALAIFTVLVVLSLRQAIIIGLVIISPLAFVAYMLPNTEGLFKKWWSIFKSLLLLFPVISFVFAGSALASVILTTIGTSMANDSFAGFTFQVMGAAVSIVPLFLTTIFMKATSGALGNITGMVNNKNKGLIDRSRKYAGEKQQEKYLGTLANGQAQGRFGAGGSKNPLNKGVNFLRKRRFGATNRQGNIKASEAALDAGAAATTQGQAIIGRQIAAQNQMSTAQSTGKQAYYADPANEAELTRLKVAELDLSEAEKRADAKIHATPEVEAAAIKSKIADDMVKAVEARTDAVHEELKTSAAGAVHGIDAATVADAQTAAGTLYIQQQRAGMAGMRLKQDLATMIGDDPSTPTQAAIDAGGVMGLQGISLAQAQARQTHVQALNTAVAAEKSKLSARSNDELIADLRAGNGSMEYQAAIAGEIMSRNHRASHLEAIDIIMQRGAAATGDDIGVVETIQQQMYADMKDKPFAVGDTTASQLQIGTLGRSATRSGQSQKQITSLKEEMKTRAGTKTSPKAMVTMDPDELKSYHKMARDGELTGPQLTQFQESIRDLLKDKTLKGSVKPEAKVLYDEILSGTYAPNPTNGNRSLHYDDNDVF